MQKIIIAIILTFFSLFIFSNNGGSEISQDSSKIKNKTSNTIAKKKAVQKVIDKNPLKTKSIKSPKVISKNSLKTINKIAPKNIIKDTSKILADKDTAEIKEIIKPIEITGIIKNLIANIDNSKSTDVTLPYNGDKRLTELDIILNTANKNFLSGKYDLALKEYSAALTPDLKNIDKVRINELIGRVYLAKGSLEDLARTYKEIVTIDTNGKYSKVLIDIYLQENNFKAAQDLLGHSLKSDAGNLALKERSGDFLMLDKDYEKARAIFQDILEENPAYKSARLYYNLGIIESNLNLTNKGDALFFFKKSLEIDSSFTYAYVEMGKISFYIKDYESAIKILNKYTSLIRRKKQRDFNIKDKEAYYYLGLSAFFIGQDDLAVKSLNKVSSWKDYAVYYKSHANRFLGERTGKQSALDKAKKDFTKLEDKIRSPYIKYSLVLLALDENKPKDAVELMKALIKEEPDFLKVYQAKADFLIGIGEYAEAKSTILMLLQKKGNNDIYTMLKLASLAVKTEEYEMAISVLKSAKKISPKTSEIYQNLAATYLIMGENKLAQHELNKVLEFDKKNEDALVARAEIYFKSDKIGKAYDDMNFVLKKINRKNIKALILRGKCLIFKSKKAKACADFNKAKAYAESYKNELMSSYIEGILRQHCD